MRMTTARRENAAPSPRKLTTSAEIRRHGLPAWEEEEESKTASFS